MRIRTKSCMIRMIFTRIRMKLILKLKKLLPDKMSSITFNNYLQSTIFKLMKIKRFKILIMMKFKIWIKILVIIQFSLDKGLKESFNFSICHFLLRSLTLKIFSKKIALNFKIKLQIYCLKTLRFKLKI
jgi:hypothetical protein